ncbi:HdeD family acid-resistance protein [Methylocapsa palsarum]|uniref:Uncharacterized membrane protein HdeD, DUF308 family n=1 Tax=Methylocapsa palsarum TaxID=1612308 RepID=A0A1I3WVC7_9HYPH|nr:DUF308 domain-containing protein [Methylocapsa palsarum]SFK10391.1 Uncharacterized membrane protein HdeD, DUF308 family [Methylocapsa palsarum]
MPSSPDFRPLSDDPRRLDTAIAQLRHRWGWIVGFGSLLTLMGFAALGLVVSATIVSVYSIAIFMVIAGGSEIALGIGARTWSRFFLWVAAGAVYLVAAAFAFAQPLVAAAAFTLLLGVGMIATGAMRIYFATKIDPGARDVILAAGVLTAIVGLLILVGWPANSFFVLGILLGLDLIFWGAGWIFFGLRLRQAA